MKSMAITEALKLFGYKSSLPSRGEQNEGNTPLFSLPKILTQNAAAAGSGGSFRKTSSSSSMVENRISGYRAEASISSSPRSKFIVTPFMKTL